jgi:CubicO group peptidase (beta-lactamase class C family)
MNAAWQDSAAFAVAHETPWPRNPATAPGPGEKPFGVHHADPAPFNQTLGPLHVRGGVSGCVWQRGHEVTAWGDPERPDQTFSVAKTCLALLAGVAQGRGLLPDVDQAVVQRLPGIGFDSEHNRSITWRHLLEQTSEWEGRCFGLPDQVERWRVVAHDPRPPGGIKGGARPLCAPGSYWEYNDVRINQLALALLHLFEQPLPEVFDQALMQPLGASRTWRWQGYDEAWLNLGGRRLQSVPGGTHWGGGLSISARDLLLLGRLLLQQGQWNGEPVVSASWARQMQQPTALAPFYGWLMWLNTDGRPFPGASRRSSFMVGAGGHLVWIEPEFDAVVVVRWLDSAHLPGFLQRAHAALAA